MVDPGLDGRVALLIGEFARRHLDRGADWGRIIGLTSGGPGGFPEEASYGRRNTPTQTLSKP